MTDADLDKLEALAKSATQGEWRAWITRRRQPEIYTDGGSSEQNDKIASGVLRKADAAFIAGANPATILDLIASARRDAEEIERLKRELAAADGRTADYRTVAINQGWNWATCNAYGREEYAKHRGEHVDACVLNAAEARARAAHTGEG